LPYDAFQVSFWQDTIRGVVQDDVSGGDELMSDRAGFGIHVGFPGGLASTEHKYNQYAYGKGTPFQSLPPVDDDN
jgi:hypothetical protein